jgi:hypothetical protein
MPLPDKVIEQLGREPASTQGWAIGVIMFSGSVLFIMVLLWAGLVYGYEPSVNNQLGQTQAQITDLGNKISISDQANLITYYSQISNLNALLGKHVYPSLFFKWLSQNTEANVYYSSINMENDSQVTFSAVAKTEDDVNQQAIIFEDSPQVLSVNISNVAVSVNGAGGYNFNATLKLSPSVFQQPTTAQ